MSKVVQLIKSIDAFIQKAKEDEENLTDIVADFPGLELLPDFVEEYEKTTARLLRRQRKLFLDELKGFVSKDDRETLETILQYFTNDLFAADEFAKEFGEETAEFLQMTIKELSAQIMQSIDREVAFNTLSRKTVDWIEEWSHDLATMMQLNTHRAVERVLLEGIENGASIQEIELKLKDLPQFNRQRARTTAITEVLTASSAAQYESYRQSPAVTGKKWKHSGTKGIEPRMNHMKLDGTVVPVDEPFIIPDSDESAMFPRDPGLSAKERVNCHCVMGPAVDESILGLSKEEKEQLRQEAIEEMGGPSIQEDDLLPGYSNAAFSDEKLTSYALNMDHPVGKDKAVAFEKSLGYTKENYEDLKKQIIENLPKYKAEYKGNNGHGDLYEVVMDLKGPNQKRANVLSAWINDGNQTRLISVYVTNKGVKR